MHCHDLHLLLIETKFSKLYTVTGITPKLIHSFPGL